MAANHIREFLERVDPADLRAAIRELGAEKRRTIAKMCRFSKEEVKLRQIEASTRRGKAYWANRTPEERSEFARKGVIARWAGKTPEERRWTPEQRARWSAKLKVLRAPEPEKVSFPEATCRRIMEAVKEGTPANEVAREYGVEEKTIHRVLRYYKWQHRKEQLSV